MKSMTDILSIVVGLLAFAAAIWQLLVFLGSKDPNTGVPDMWAGTSHLVVAILAAIIACVCLAVYFVRHHKEAEEIHITDR